MRQRLRQRQGRRQMHHLLEEPSVPRALLRPRTLLFRVHTRYLQQRRPKPAQLPGVRPADHRCHANLLVTEADASTTPCSPTRPSFPPQQFLMVSRLRRDCRSATPTQNTHFFSHNPHNSPGTLSFPPNQTVALSLYFIQPHTHAYMPTTNTIHGRRFSTMLLLMVLALVLLACKIVSANDAGDSDDSSPGTSAGSPLTADELARATAQYNDVKTIVDCIE